MKDFLNKSKIKGMTYTPHFLTLNGTLQAIMYLLNEIYLKLTFPIKYERELFKLSDGGTIALDWVIDHEGGVPLKGSSRPVICCIAGLSGGNDNLYTYSMLREAQ